MKPANARGAKRMSLVATNELSVDIGHTPTAVDDTCGADHPATATASVVGGLPTSVGADPAATPRSAALRYYEAIEQASADMLAAARGGDWDAVVKLEGACALLISQLKHAAAAEALDGQGAQLKSVIMQRILLNDAEIRHLAEPWLDDLDNLLAGRSKTLH